MSYKFHIARSSSMRNMVANIIEDREGGMGFQIGSLSAQTGHRLTL